MGNLRTFLLMLGMMPILSLAAWAEPPADSDGQLVNPATPALPQRLVLPEVRPEIEQASYWRSSKSEKPDTSVRTKDEETLLPPIELEQPATLVPLIQAKPIKSQKGNNKNNEKQSSTIEQDIQLAMAKFERAPSRSAALLVVAREMALESHTIGDFGDVIEQCHRALDANPNKPTGQALAKLGAWAYNRRGELLIDQGNEHEAFDNFQEAVLLDNDCWQAFHNRGVTLARYAKHSEALSDFDRVIEIAPDFAVARYNRAEVLSQLERWELAIKDYNVALQSLEEDASLYAARGHAFAQLGQSKAAVSDFNSAIRIEPNTSVAYLGRGNLFASQRMYEQAATDFEQALKLDPRSADAYRSTAWLLATCPIKKYRNGEQAVVAAQRLAQLLGDENPLVLDSLAAAYAETGNFSEAIPYQQAAIIMTTDTKDKQTYIERLDQYRRGRAYRTE